MRRRIAIAAAVIVVVAAAGVVFLSRSGGSGGPAVKPIAASSPASCFAGTGAREVRFSAGKDKPIFGAVLGTGPVGVVLAHQAQADMCQWLDYAGFLAKRGYRVLAFDFPDGYPHAPADDASVVAAGEALRSLGARKVVLMGASRGGAAVLAASRTFSADAVIALSAPALYNDSHALAGVEASKAPLLIAVGALDSAFVGDDIELAKHARSPSKQLIVKKGSGEHGVLLLEFSGHSVVDDAVLKLLASVQRKRT